MKDGGYIFPLRDVLLPQPGMSLRDAFALIIVWKLLATDDLAIPDRAAQRTYGLADAMLKARDEGRGGA